jgi:protein-disulfide isomerase
MVTPNIRDEIAGRKRKGALDTFVRTLSQRYGTFYTAPISERFTFTSNERNGPEKGPADAPVTIVEYSDLECSYCSRAHSYLGELAKRRGDEIRIIYKHYPLEMHPHAFFAAEIAVCAHRQGQFWPLADLLFKQQKTFSDNKIRMFAEQVGLDMVQLDKCIDSGEGKRAVEADIAEGDALGISSTPSFFVNGHYIGSLPPGGLDALIDRELGLAGLDR